MPFVTLATIFGDLEPGAQDEVMERMNEQASARMEAYIKAAKRATGMRDLTGAEKLEAYRRREPELWAKLQSQFPQEYDKQMKDWGRMETGDSRRSFRSPVLAPSALNAASRIAVKGGQY